MNDLYFLLLIVALYAVTHWLAIAIAGHPTRAEKRT